MLPGDDITYSDENKDDGSLIKRKKKEKVKEEILDETFKKAEFLKKTQPAQEKRKTGEKPFFKSGIMIIIIAIIALALINYTPWMYAKYDVGDTSTQQFFYKDFENEEFENNETCQKVMNLFESNCTNCTDNSQNYIGLTVKDFETMPKLTTYGFIALIVLGLFFTIFVIIDRFRNFAFEKSYLVCSIFTAGYVVTSVFILLLSIKFLASHFLLYHNDPFIKTSGLTNITLIFLAPIIIIVFCCAIMKGSMMVMKINFREMEKRLESEEPKKKRSIFRYGGAQI